MTDAEIIRFAHSDLEPMGDSIRGPRYRCAAHLNDGLYLPCVVLEVRERTVELAKRRFAESIADAQLPESSRKYGVGMQYDDLVRSFVTAGNCLNAYDIARLEKSRFAIPLAQLHQIRGETRMSWTQFVGVMRDGKRVAFGTPFNFEFFSMPDGYSGDDIVRIISHETGTPLYRDRTFFTCYVSGL